MFPRIFSVRGEAPWIPIVLIVLLASRAFSLDLLVSNNNDSGPGSLRQAVLDNNLLGGGNTILFSNTVTGTITLTSGELLVTKHVIIAGPGPENLAVNGNAASRVFHIAVTNDAATLLFGLTITNGVAPACCFPSNFGGGIWNNHSLLVVRNCTISGNSASFGGGICNDGSFGSASCRIEDSTLSGNSTPNGGAGIYNYGYQGVAAVTLISSTVHGNTAATTGGGILNYGFEGFASLSANASTFTSNSALASGVFIGGGAIYSHGLSGNAGTIIHASTFSGNSAESGGAIFNNAPSGSATAEVGNTLFHAGALGGTVVNNFGTFTSRGYNLSSDNGGGVLTNATDQVNTDPMLGPLTNNGGPAFTHALLPGSPAIDKGKRDAISLLFLTSDQRGAPRPFDFAALPNAAGGDGSDIGAFELGTPELSLERVGNNALLSWPSYYGDFSLQSTTNLTLPTNWIPAAGSAAVVGNRYQQTNGPISNHQFFRLRAN